MKKRRSDYKDISATETSDWPLSFGDLRSVGDCHEECVGCTESRSASACLSCKHFTQTLRNRAGYKCVSHCDDGFYADGDRCKRCSVDCSSCTSAEKCDTCHGAKLLVDSNDHFGHFDNGRCVDQCSIGLVSDYTTNLLQARCVIKNNSCSAGYFENMLGTCVECDSTCAICHGPGTLQCDECAPGYSNRTLGFCRPCCAMSQHNNATTALPASTWAHGGFASECEDCRSDYKGPTHQALVFSSEGSYVSNFDRYGDENGFGSSTTWLFFLSLIIIFLGAFAFCVCAQMLCVRWNNGDWLLGAWVAATTGSDLGLNMEYTSLKNVDDDLERHGVATRPLIGRPNEDVESGIADSSLGCQTSLKLAYGSDSSESEADDCSPIH